MAERFSTAISRPRASTTPCGSTIRSAPMIGCCIHRTAHRHPARAGSRGDRYLRVTAVWSHRRRRRASSVAAATKTAKISPIAACLIIRQQRLPRIAAQSRFCSFIVQFERHIRIWHRSKIQKTIVFQRFRTKFRNLAHRLIPFWSDNAPALLPPAVANRSINRARSARENEGSTRSHENCHGHHQTVQAR